MVPSAQLEVDCSARFPPDHSGGAVDRLPDSAGHGARHRISDGEFALPGLHFFFAFEDSRLPRSHQPLLAVQAVLPEAQISVGLALVVFAQTFGGAIFLTIAQTIFTNSLRDKMIEYLPNTDVRPILAAGATGGQEGCIGRRPTRRVAGVFR